MIIESDTQRKFSRINFDRQVDIEFVHDRFDHCQIKNLSLAGMFVQGNFKHREGKPCHIDLGQQEIPEELNLQALAKVVRNDDDGIAVEFSAMTFDSYMYLQTSLFNGAENSAVTGKMLRENCPFAVAD